MKSRYPFSSFPTSWYQIDLAKNIKTGKTNRYLFFGRELACARDDQGKLVLEELGPESNNSKRYKTQEVNGIVFAYFNAHSTNPHYEVPEIPEFLDSQWSRVRTVRYQAVSHVQEFVENAVDTGHFITVHQMPAIPQVSKFELDGPCFNFSSIGYRKVLHFRTPMDIRVRPVGLAVILGWTVTDFLEIKNIHCVTPINESQVQVSVSYVFKKNWNPLRTLILHLVLNQALFNFTSPDLPIFAKKKYVEKPLLCRNDGPIARVRQWARQFYEEQLC